MFAQKAPRCVPSRQRQTLCTRQEASLPIKEALKHMELDRLHHCRDRRRSYSNTNQFLGDRSSVVRASNGSNCPPPPDFSNEARDEPEFGKFILGLRSFLRHLLVRQGIISADRLDVFC